MRGRGHTAGMRGRMGAGAAPSPPLAGYYAFYRFDNSLADSSGHGRALGVVTSVSYAAGLIGQALSGGSVEKADWATGINWASSSWSISAWINYASTGDGVGAQIILTRGTQVAKVEARESGGAPSVVVEIGDGSGGKTVAVSLGWLHVVMTWNGSVATFYLNNVLGTAPTGTIPSSTGDTDLFIQTDGDFLSSVDLLGVYAKTLSAGEVAALYNAGAGFDPTA